MLSIAPGKFSTLHTKSVSSSQLPPSTKALPLRSAQSAADRLSLSPRSTTTVRVSASQATPSQDASFDKLRERYAAQPPLKYTPGQHEPEKIDALLFHHFEDAGHWDNAATLHEEFQRTGYAQIDNFLPQKMYDDVLELTVRVLRKYGEVRSQPNPYSGTARKMISASNTQLKRHVKIIDAIYRSPVKLALEGKIFGTKVLPLAKAYELDQFVAHMKFHKGDVLAAHIDPSPGTTVFVLRAPPKGVGGHVGFNRPPDEAYGPNRTLDPSRVLEIIERYPRFTKEKHPPHNSEYLLNTSDCPHWTYELLAHLPEGEERVNITFSHNLPEIDKRTPEQYLDVYRKEVESAFPTEVAKQKSA